MFRSELVESVHGGAHESDWVAAKHVLRYLQGTLDYGLDYRQGDGVRLAGYTDSD